MSQPSTSKATLPSNRLPTNLNPHASPHSRRPPAHRSVSLRHTPPIPQGIQALGRPSSLAAKGGLKEVGGGHLPSSRPRNSSSEESSNAEQWFEKSNNNVKENASTVNDVTPPFYFQNSSNDSPEDGDQPGVPPTSLPLRPGQTQERSLASSSEEYRSVIDDLTIENKRLKRRLRRFQRPDVPEMRSDKLFEIRFHGLSAKRRRELEDTLRVFAAGLNSPGEEASGSNSAAQAPQSLRAAKPGSSQFADSGYGSMATSSMQGSRTQSGQGTAGTQDQSQNQIKSQNQSQTQSEALEAREKSIRSYLHDIPSGLLPRPAAVMSEKSKKKLVVRRLEQVFVGRGAAVEGHQQPIQQQEVSRLAASDDRKASEAKGETIAVEGPREARIMNMETEEPMDLQSESEKTPNGPSSSSSADRKLLVKAEEHTKDGDFSEQRPTRPLDLDLHRAQVATENLEYIRHLGFSLPHTGGLAPMDEGGWIYLNLLSNMAQVHTLNVTAEFVRQAIAEYSSKLNLSQDGRKIRWNGDSDTAGNGSSSGAEGNTPGSIYSPGDKRPRPAHVEESSSPQLNGNPNKKQVSTPGKYDQSFIYKPLIWHQRTSDSDSGSESLDDDDSVMSSPVIGDHTGAESSYLQSNGHRAPNHGRHRDGGPLIFYTNAKFCIDLSGDAGRQLRPHSTAEYSPFTATPVGEMPKFDEKRRIPSKFSERPLYRTRPPPSPMVSDDADDTSEASFEELHFPQASPKHVTFAEPAQPIEFVASGVGGVRPDDNLATHVLRRRTTSVEKTVSNRPASKLSKSLPKRFNRLKIEEKVLSVRRDTLTPSSLPPASFAYMDVDGDNEDEEDEVSGEEAGYVGASLSSLRPVLAGFSDDMSVTGSWASHSISSTAPEVASNPENGADAMDESDEQSIDFLAQARSVDPAAIHAREREYDADMAERLADEIPAGSSAATAGGGSGFNSPDDPQSHSQPQAYQGVAHFDRKQPHTSNATVAAYAKEEEDDEEDDEDEAKSSVSS